MKKKIIRGIVFGAPIGIGDNVFLTSYMRYGAEKAKKQLNLNENDLTFKFTVFTHKASASLFEVFEHDKIYVQDTWKLRKLKVFMILLFKRYIFGQRYQFLVAYKTQTWLMKALRKTYVLTNPLGNTGYIPFSVYNNKALLPYQQIMTYHIPYKPWIPLSDQAKKDMHHLISSDPNDPNDSKTPFFVIAPFTNAPIKNWPFNHWEVFLKQMNHAYPKHKFYFVGSIENEHHLTKFCSFVQKGRVLLNSSFATIAALIVQSDLTIGLETGVFNLGVAMIYQGYDAHVLGICGMKKDILVPYNNKQITYVSLKKPFDNDAYLLYLKQTEMAQQKGEIMESKIQSITPQHVLDALHKAYPNL